ncbi:hypothetical protein L1887_36714 [Cichorium endivia]|nr:hypothetical protein L1887_36714 [Cichorium endivia]
MRAVFALWRSSDLGSIIVSSWLGRNQERVGMSGRKYHRSIKEGGVGSESSSSEKLMAREEGSPKVNVSELGISGAGGSAGVQFRWRWIDVTGWRWFAADGEVLAADEVSSQCWRRPQRVLP